MIAGTGGPVDLTKLDGTFNALTKAGSDNNQTAAKAAVTALFAGASVGTGSINSYNTSIQSDAGGDINLLAPAGTSR